jgi:3',5'-cyclic AMP phosphodiesterase CpdA
MMALHRNRWIVFAVLVGLAAVAVAAWTGYSGREPAGDGVFLVKPYLQWGAGPRPGSTGGVEVLWQGADRDESWSLEVRRMPDWADSFSSVENPWVAAAPTTMRRVVIERIVPRRLYRAVVPAGPPGHRFGYRIRRGGELVFESRACSPWTEAHPHRFVVFGDGGADTWDQRAIAYQTCRALPDFVFITGDLVYYKGSFFEYLRHFFPIYNSDQVSPRTGAPLLRSTLFLAAAGNHDLIERDLDSCPDGLAFFLLWSLPLNGPIGTPGAANTPVLRGSLTRQRAFLDLAGPTYPRMANYAFDYGGAHWTVLDTNAYADWTDPELRAWLARDLSSDAARKADWRFVAFHQPPFQSAKEHADEQWTRVLVDLLEKSGVDIVFCGHIHNYQRTYPLRFVAAGGVAANGHVPGRWTLDTAYDGVTQTCPDGIIYIVSGAGGAKLYSREQHHDFTAKFIANTHSLTVVDVASRRLTLRQVSAAGLELDRFVVTRREPAPEDP